MVKRGQITLLAIITLLLAVAVAVTVPNIAKSYATGSVALKKAADRDIALILNSLCSYPDDAEIIYGVDLSKFIVVIKDEKVTLYDSSFTSLSPSGNIAGEDPVIAQYSFACNQALDFTINKPRSMTIKKKDGIISISKNENI